MPLTMTRPGTNNQITQINGKDEIKRFLTSLGFVIGEKVIVISQNAGNMIVNIKDTRIAISQSLANRIIVA